MSSPVLVFLGFAAYAAVHSALLTETARGALEAWWGRRAFRGWFRLGFTVQAVVLLGGYVVWVAGLPDVQWWVAPGAVAAFLWAVRAVALGVILYCTSLVGLAEFVGWAQYRAWARGGPTAGDGVETGVLVAVGPYRWVRHPMYSAGLVLLWASPRWSANGFAFSLAASLYLWLGALHEERRLLRYYGTAYREYRQRTPRLLPRRPRGR